MCARAKSRKSWQDKLADSKGLPVVKKIEGKMEVARTLDPQSLRTGWTGPSEGDEATVGKLQRTLTVFHQVAEALGGKLDRTELLNAISEVNLMTVQEIEIKDIDEYKELERYGYYYGNVDAVELTLQIETIWLREWTAGHNDEKEAARLGQPFNPGLMPDVIRSKLDLNPRDPNFGRSNGFSGNR